MEQPGVPLAINMPDWLLICFALRGPVELRFSVEWGLYFSRWSKDHLGMVCWKRGDFTGRLAYWFLLLHCIIKIAKGRELGQTNNSITSLSEIEWDKPIPHDFLILSKLYLLSSQLLECRSSSTIDSAGWILGVMFSSEKQMWWWMNNEQHSITLIQPKDKVNGTLWDCKVRWLAGSLTLQKMQANVHTVAQWQNWLTILFLVMSNFSVAQADVCNNLYLVKQWSIQSFQGLQQSV